MGKKNPLFSLGQSIWPEVINKCMNDFHSQKNHKYKMTLETKISHSYMKPLFPTSVPTFIKIGRVGTSCHITLLGPCGQWSQTSCFNSQWHHCASKHSCFFFKFTSQHSHMTSIRIFENMVIGIREVVQNRSFMLILHKIAETSWCFYPYKFYPYKQKMTFNKHVNQKNRTIGLCNRHGHSKKVNLKTVCKG